MGVDLSIDTAVGFVIDEGGFDRFREDHPDASDFDPEVLEHLWKPLQELGLTYGSGGSEYSGERQSWIGVDRLTKSYDGRSIPGGIFGLNQPTITLAERVALNTVASWFGMSTPAVGQFMSVHWY